MKPISFKAQMKMDLAAEREYMFDYVYKEERNVFTEPTCME